MPDSLTYPASGAILRLMARPESLDRRESPADAPATILITVLPGARRSRLGGRIRRVVGARVTVAVAVAAVIVVVVAGGTRFVVGVTHDRGAGARRSTGAQRSAVARRASLAPGTAVVTRHASQRPPIRLSLNNWDLPRAGSG